MGHSVDVELAVFHGLLMLPEGFSRVQAEIAYGGVGEIGAEGFGVGHRQAQHPGFHIHSGWFRRHDKAETGLTQLRHGQIAMKNRSISISQAEHGHIPELGQKACLSVKLCFIRSIESFRQTFRAFEFQNPHGGVRLIPYQSKIEMRFDGNAVVNKSKLQLRQNVKVVNGKSPPDAVFKPMAALQGQEFLQAALRAWGYFIQQGRSGTFQSSADV